MNVGSTLASRVAAAVTAAAVLLPAVAVAQEPETEPSASEPQAEPGPSAEQAQALQAAQAYLAGYVATGTARVDAAQARVVASNVVTSVHADALTVALATAKDALGQIGAAIQQAVSTDEMSTLGGELTVVYADAMDVVVRTHLLVAADRLSAAAERLVTAAAVLDAASTRRDIDPTTAEALATGATSLRASAMSAMNTTATVVESVVAAGYEDRTVRRTVHDQARRALVTVRVDVANATSAARELAGSAV